MPKLNILTVVQARTGSSRLANKVLMPVLNKPILVRMIERVKRSNLAGLIVVATSEKKSDDIIESICRDNDIECFRGSEDDLLDRHYKAGLKYNADAVIKIPSDCPLIDSKIIDTVITAFLDEYENFDFVSNLHPATFPDGNDVEIMKISALEKAWKNAKRKLEREHTTPYIWENPDKFKIKNVEWKYGLNYSRTHRWTLDYIEDYEFINTVYEKLYPENPEFNLNDILELLNNNKWIFDLNSKYAGKYWYENHLDELNNIEDYKREFNKQNV